MSDFVRWGGAVTFTVHLLKSLGKSRIHRIANSTDNVGQIGSFGYGITYELDLPSIIDNAANPFITDFFHYNHILPILKRDDVTAVIHDPTEIPNEKSCLQYWNIVCIRKALQRYLKEEYEVNSKFMFHPFWPYNTGRDSKGAENKNTSGGRQLACRSVSISRIEYGKNIELIMKANKILDRESSNNNELSIRMYGPFNQMYVEDVLGGYQNFDRYYCGTFPKSFNAISNVLNGTKFVIDLSTIANDGGGTQYTFLEAIYHGAALIINRKWIENLPSEYCELKEDYNCYAVSNSSELAEIIRRGNNIDTSRIVRNSRKLLDRHINSNWSSL